MRCSRRPPDEVAEAREAMATYREAEAGGVGAIGRDGQLVDAAHMRLAANTLAQGRPAEGRPIPWSDEGAVAVRTPGHGTRSRSVCHHDTSIGEGGGAGDAWSGAPGRGRLWSRLSAAVVVGPPSLASGSSGSTLVSTTTMTFVDRARSTPPWNGMPARPSRMLVTSIWYPSRSGSTKQSGHGPYPLIVFAGTAWAAHRRTIGRC